MAYKLPPLQFGYDALEPYIDAETMEIHHDEHHQVLCHRGRSATSAQ
jgi:superoxide dismutase, Fe-Mn family